MGFLGYDPQLVDQLRAAARRSSDELAGVRCADPEAIDAMSALHAARRVLEHEWLPVIEAVLACRVMEARPSPWSFATGPITSDPLTAWAPAATLLDRPIDVLSAEELVTLAATLASIATDPAAAAASRRMVGDDSSWAQLFDTLGLDRLDQQTRLVWDPDDRRASTRLALLDTLIVPLAAIYSAGPHDSHVAWFPTVIQQLDPYSAAILLVHLDLDAHVQAAAADLVLTRWMDGHDGRRVWRDPTSPGPNTADIIFQWLSRDAGAARRFVQRASSHPEVLFRTTAGDTPLQALLLAATHPSAVSTSEAGAMIRPLIEWTITQETSMTAAADGGVDAVHSIFAAVVSPWLMQFGGRAHEWSWGRPDGDAALRWVIDDEDAAVVLLTRMTSVWQHTLAATEMIDGRGVFQAATVGDLAELFAQLLGALHAEELEDAITSRMWLDVTLLIGQAVASAVLPGGLAISVGLDVTMSALAPVARAWIERNVSGNDADADSQDAGARFGSRTADVAVVAVVAAVGQLIATGALPPDALDALQLDDLDGCTARGVDHTLAVFVEGLRDATDPATYNALHAVRLSFINASSADQLCR